MLQIKIHGLGGQGAVIAAKLLANAAAEGGYKVQSFSSYGAERRGGKVESYLRISEKDIYVHSKMYEPDCVVLMDENFAKNDQVISGLKKTGSVLINSSKRPETFPLPANIRTVTIDANNIARDQGLLLPTGTPIINTTILGAIAAMFPNRIRLEHLSKAMREGKIPFPDKNIRAAKESYHRVKSQLEGNVNKMVGDAPRSSIMRYPIYRQKMPPCEANCPAGEAIHTTVSLIQRNQFDRALENIKAENPFPGICGRVCFHPCEANCNRKELDEKISINALERAVFDYANEEETIKPEIKENTKKRIAIIGSGPAGMTCGYYLTILGHDVVLYEKLPVLGGIPRAGIPTHRLPRDVVDREVEQIIKLGIEVKTNTEIGKDITFNYLTQKYDACFVATGAHQPVSFNVPGEDNKSVISGLEFLKNFALAGRVKVGPKVAVIGGGNTAVDAARVSKRLGAQDVIILYRRSTEEMPAYPEEVTAAKNEGIEIFHMTVVIAIYSGGNGKTKLECMKTMMGQKDKDGRHRPEPVEGTNFMVDVDTVIVAVGETPMVSFLPGDIEMDGSLIKVDYLGRTSMAGVYAGGDATSLSRSVVEAIASGKRAALGIDLELACGEEKIYAAIWKGESGAISMARYLAKDFRVEDKGVVSFTGINSAYFRKSPRIRVIELHLGIRSSNFDEVSLGLSKTEAIEEAERCFQCGQCSMCENCYIFCPEVAVKFDGKTSLFAANREICKGCGICLNECPSGVIAWEGESE